MRAGAGQGYTSGMGQDSARISPLSFAPAHIAVVAV